MPPISGKGLTADTPTCSAGNIITKGPEHYQCYFTMRMRFQPGRLGKPSGSAFRPRNITGHYLRNSGMRDLRGSCTSVTTTAALLAVFGS
jgi:hypothetical protein